MGIWYLGTDDTLLVEKGFVSQRYVFGCLNLAMVGVDDGICFSVNLVMLSSLSYGMGMKRNIECWCCWEFLYLVVIIFRETS